MKLTDSVRKLKGIGEKTADLLKKLNIETVEDLVRYYPRAYDQYEPPVKICEITGEGIFAAEASPLKRPDVRITKRLKIVTASLRDGSGVLSAVWFNMPYLTSGLKPGAVYIFRGKVKRERERMIMEHPAVFSPAQYEKLLHTGQPVYNLTAGLTNKLMTKAAAQALDELPVMKEYLPEWIRTQYELAEYNFAVRSIHFPQEEQALKDARKRLIFDEFFFFILVLSRLRGSENRKKNDFIIHSGAEMQQLLSSLPYELTGGQKETLRDILKDMGGETVMNRLVQGDVGSGKTIVAVAAMLAAVENGYQAAMMAPTEVLARQHYESICRLFEAAGIRRKVLLLTGSMTAREKREAYEQIRSHQADVVVGTHALIQTKTEYAALGLVITDEQHRFGVHQRETFSEKGGAPHVLVMSATPIPRTLAIILYGDLDISVIDELPAKRLPIKNCVVGTSYRPNAYRFIGEEIRKGRQAYVICPMVEESELMEGENVMDYAVKLREVFPASVRVEALHGKMSAEKKDEIMTAFAAGQIHILVSTTVVEVGVDVPNATVMMVENAERFGLAQLHQLRGRVGRGAWQSYCIFVNGSENEEKKKRLEILNSSNDGFYIASEDLKLRGPGDVFGIRQSGLMEFAIGDVYQDAELLKAAASAAKKLLAEDPDLESDENRVLKQKIEEELQRREALSLAL